MDGQWVGSISGRASDTVLLNIDRRSEHYSGSAVFFSNDNTRISLFHIAFAFLTNGRADGGAVHIGSFQRFFFANVAISMLPQEMHRYLGQSYTCKLMLRLTFELLKPKMLRLNIYLDTQLLDSAELSRDLGDDGQPRKVTSLKLTDLTWEEYKSTSANWEVEGKAFRGQTKPWPVRTKFHRARRFDLIKYADEDIPRLKEIFGSKFDRPLDPAKGGDLIPLLALAQHHGYPTPFLDWTRSPDIAAYFSCRETCDEWPQETTQPTIFVFDIRLWETAVPQTFGFGDPRPGIAILKADPASNDRLRFQQGLHTYCNVDPWEFHVGLAAELKKVELAWGYRIVGDYRAILRELRDREIRAGTLFPDDDGKCRDLFELSVLNA
jgi:hypothetical protein